MSTTIEVSSPVFRGLMNRCCTVTPSSRLVPMVNCQSTLSVMAGEPLMISPGLSRKSVIAPGEAMIS